MADVKISALPGGTTLAGTEAMPAVQSAATVKTTPAAIATYVSANLTTPNIGAATGTSLVLTGGVTVIGGAQAITTNTALTNGAGIGAGTLTTAPSAGNPTKWIGINDNGTIRYIPAW